MNKMSQDIIENKSKFTLKKIWSEYRIIFVLIIIYIVATLLTGGKFGTWGNIQTILRNASTIGVIALGMTYVIISGGIDLSSGAVMATAGVVLIYMQKTQQFPLIVMMLACIGTGVVFGFFNGIIITKAKLPPFIVTLAIGIIARSLTMYVAVGATIRGEEKDTFFNNLGIGKIGGIPIPLVIMLVIAVMLTIILTKTKFGTYIFSVGCNEKAAGYSGINVDRIKTYTYMIAGACVGIAAFMEMSRMVAVSSTTTGSNYEFDAITAVLVGGTSLAGGRGAIYGTVIGAIILASVNNIMIHLNISTYLAGTMKGVIILSAVLLQLKGLKNKA